MIAAADGAVIILDIATGTILARHETATPLTRMRCEPGCPAPPIVSAAPCGDATLCELVLHPFQLVPVLSRILSHALYPDPTGDLPLLRSPDPDDPSEPLASRRSRFFRIDAGTGRRLASRVDPLEVLGYPEPVLSPDGYFVVCCGTSGHILPDATTLGTLAEVPGLYASPPAFDADGARICLSRWSGPVEIASIADLLAAR